jgi:hypothetical protein
LQRGTGDGSGSEKQREISLPLEHFFVKIFTLGRAFDIISKDFEWAEVSM